MKSVIKHLGGIEKAIADTSKSVDGSGLSGQFKSAARSLDTASGNMAKSLQPLKAELRVLKATAANIDFGGVTDDRQFKKATTAVNAYIKKLKELKGQIQGDTAAEREFTEILKRQQRVMKDKLALHDAERKAAFFSQRKGEFGALQQVGGVVLNPLRQIGKEATQIYADFDDKMSAVAAISRSTGKDLDRLRTKAKYLGATTRFTAGQAADSEKFLAAAGFNAQQIFAGVPATLDLASAGQLGLAESADIASNVLSGMRMGVSDLGHITDVMALAAASANTNIQQLGVAMSYAAPNAALFGAGIEETSAMIGVMSNAGIQADKAGTAARGAFLKLAAPTLKGRMALNQYGISITDTSGKMRNIVDVMQDIGTSLQLDPAALASIVEAGDDVEKLGAIAQSKQISALKDIFGTTGISGASAAISQMQEFTRLSLAGKGSSFAVDDYEKLFKSQGIKKLDSDKDVFVSLLRESGSYQGALEKLDIATIQLVKSNEYLGNLSGSEMAKLSGYFQVPDGENLFDTILATAPNANTAVSKLTSAMGELGIEFKGKAGAAKTMAQVMENNLAGSFRSLGSAFEAVQVNLIEPIAPIIRGIADSLTKLLLIVANLPAPVRGLIAGAGALAIGFAAVAVVAGTVGVALFGFSQAAATATAAGIALQASVIPLTGFFPAAMDAFAGTASNPFETASFAAEAFSDTITSTSKSVNFRLSDISRNIAMVSRSLVSMSVSFALSPIGIAIASFLALNAILHQINPEINLLGTIFSAVSSVAGFAVGVIQGFGEALLQALDIPTSIAGSILTAPFTAVSSAIEYATVAFDAWRKSGRTIGADIFKFVAQPFQLAGKAIEDSWDFTLNYIKGLLTPFANFVARIGKLLQGGLAEASPGPTYMIREKWDYTIAFLEKLFDQVRVAASSVNGAFLAIGSAINTKTLEAQETIFQSIIDLLFNVAILADRATFALGSLTDSKVIEVPQRILQATKDVLFGVAKQVWAIHESLGASGANVFRVIVAPFDSASRHISVAWKTTIDYIKGLLIPFAGFVASIGKLLQGGLAEASPGPTYMIREKWDYTIAFLEKLFIRIRNAAGLVNRAFLGIGDVTESSKVEAQQQILQGTINLVTNSVKKLSVVGEAIAKVREFERSIIDGVKDNFDFLSFTLLTLSSLPLTLLAQLEKGAALIVPELAFIIGDGIPRAFLYAMPGLVAIAISTGLVKGIERGFMGAIDAMPEFLEKTSDKIYGSLSEGVKQQLNQGLSEGLTSFARSMPALFPGGVAIDIDIDKSYSAIKDFIRGPLEGLITYLHRVGDLSKEIGKEIYAGIEPILSFDPFRSFPLFSSIPPLIPLVTAIWPMEKALVSLAKSPSVQGIMAFLSGTILPAALRTITTISSLIIFTFNAIVTLPVVAVLQEITSRLTPIGEILRAIALNIQLVGIAIGRTLLLAIDHTIVGIVALIMEIPYIGKHLSAALLIATKALGSFFQLIAASAPRYLNLLLRFFPTKQLIALFSSYKKIFIDLISGVVYIFREGLAPIANILMKALNPAAAFKFLAFYVRTKGLSGIIKKGGFGGLSQIFNLANYINPVDIALGLNKTLNEVARLVSGDGVPLDFISRKQADIFQVLATPAARRLAEREKRLVSLVEILEGASGPMKVFIKLVQGLMMVSPIVQIISRLALTMLFWYNILKPVNKEMIDAIANTRILGISLMPLAKILEVTRFLVVDLGEALFRFLKMIPGMAATVIDIFDQLGTIIGVTIHEIVGVSSILANVFKFAVINPLAGILLAVTAVADGSLIAILEVFKLIRLKTQQYGDAIVALLHGNFVPLIKQVFSDLFGVINFGFQQTVMRAVGAITYLAKTVGVIVGESVAEIVRLIRDPIGEITRLTEQSAKNFAATVAVIMVYVRQLQLDKLVRFAADFWPQLLAVASVLARIYGLLSPIRFAIVALIELGAFLSYEYATGFKNLDKIITALQHPIDALNMAMQGIAGFLGLYISPDLTGFIGNLAEQFVKFLPVISSGVFVIALLLTRNIGGAFQLISSNVLLFIGRILQVSEAIAGVGDRVRQVAGSANVQVGLSDVANKVRRRSTIAGIANPLAYSQDFKTQQQATFLGDQRVGKSKATLRYQNELSKMERGMQRRSERDLISQVKRGTDFGKGLADTERRYYLKDNNGITEGVTGAAVEKRRNRFGIEQYKVTDIGRQLMKMSGEGGENVKAGRGAEYENMRRDAAKRSGLDAEFSRFGNAPSNEELVKLAGGKNVAIDLLSNFQKAMSNLHVDDIKTDYLYVSKVKMPSVSKDKPDSGRAFDIQLENFNKKHPDDVTLKYAVNAEKLQKSLRNTSGQIKHEDTIKGLFAETLNSGDLGVNASLAKEYGKELDAARKLGRKQYGKKIEQLVGSISEIHATAIAAKVPGFDNFEQANRQAIKENQLKNAGQVVTGFGDVAAQGVRNFVRSANEASEEIEDEVDRGHKSLSKTLFGWTGLPQIFEKLRFDQAIARQARNVERRSKYISQQEAIKAEELRKARQRGLDAFALNDPINSGGTTVELLKPLKNDSSPEGLKLNAFFDNFMKEGKFTRQVEGTELTEMRTQVARALGNDSKFSGDKGLENLLKTLKESKNFNNQDFQDLRKFIKEGIGKQKGQINEERFKDLSTNLRRNLNIEADKLHALKRVLDDKDLTQAFEQFLLTGDFVVKATQEQQDSIARLIGLASGQELRQIDRVKLKNPFEQLKVNIQLYFEDLDKKIEGVNQAIHGQFDKLETLFFRIPGIDGTAIVKPLRKFYEGIYESVLEAKKQSTKFAVDTYKAAVTNVKQSKLVSRISAVNQSYRDSQANSLETIMTMGGDKAPGGRSRLQSRMFGELAKGGIRGRTDQDKIMLAVLQDRKDQDGKSMSINSKLLDTGFAQHIEGINKALATSLGITEEKARAIANNPKYTAKAVTPYQVFLTKAFPGIVGDFVSGVTTLVAKTGAGGLIKKIVADISPALGKPVLIGISSIIDRARIAMSTGTNRIAREVEKLIGVNPFSNFLNNFSRFLARSGDSMSKFFADRANGFNAERAKSWTAKIVDKAGELFRSVAGVLGQAGNEARSQQGGILGAIGNLFSGVKNFFSNIFGNKDIIKLRKQKAAAEKLAEVQGDSRLGREAKLRATSLGREIKYREQLNSPIRKTMEALHGLSAKVRRGADALSTRSHETGLAQNISTTREASRGGARDYRSLERRGLIDTPDIDVRFDSGMAEYARNVTPLTSRASASILKGASSAARGISTYFEGAANRTETAWQEATNRITGNNWWTMVKRAAWTGIKIVTSLNHGASDVTSAAWENTEHSTAANMRQMAQVATVTGTEIAYEMQHTAQVTQQSIAHIPQAAEQAATRSTGFFHKLVGAMGGVGKAGMAVGGVVTAAGFAAQTAFFSLQNMGFIDEETAQSLYKVTEMFTLVGAVGGLATPILTALGASFAAIATVSGAVIAGVTGIGGAIAGAMGIAVLPFAPLLLGVGAVTAVVAGLYLAFKSNFLGIGILAKSVGKSLMFYLSEPIAFIQSGWQRFADAFGGKLMGIIQPAIDIGQQLINALNHNPTEKIPIAWEGATEKIQGSLGGLLSYAIGIGGGLAVGISGFASDAASTIGGFFAPVLGIFDRVKRGTEETAALPQVKSITQGVILTSSKVSQPISSPIATTPESPGLLTGVGATLGWIGSRIQDLFNGAIASVSSAIHNIIATVSAPIIWAANEIAPMRLAANQIASFFNSLTIIVQSVLYLQKALNPLQQQGVTLNEGILAIATFFYNLRGIVESIDFFRTRFFGGSMVERGEATAPSRERLPSSNSSTGPLGGIADASKNAATLTKNFTALKTSVPAAIALAGELATGAGQVWNMATEKIGGFFSPTQPSSVQPVASISQREKFIAKKTYLAAKAGTGAFQGSNANGIAGDSIATASLLPTALGVGDLGAANTKAAWSQTTSSISKDIDSLVEPAVASGYELQKAVSEGSPGPTYWIRHYWEKTVGAIGGWMGDIQKDALQTGSILHGSLANSASEILLSPPKSDLKSQAIRSTSYFMLAVGDRYQYLADRGVGSAAVLFAPGMEYVKSSLGQLGGDFVDFAGRSVKALLTLNFVELGDAVGDFFGNFKYGFGGVLSGFNSMSLSAIAFGLFSLSGISPLLLVLGAVAFGAAVITANFLGIRTILAGLIKIGIGAGKILFGVLWGLGEAASAFKKVLQGILPALRGDFTLMNEGFRGLEVAFWKIRRSIVEGLKLITKGLTQILQGVGEALEQVFKPLGFTLNATTEAIQNFFAGFKNGEQAGEMMASILIDAVKSVVGAVSGAIDSIKKRIPEVQQFFVDSVDRAVQSVKESFIKLQEFVKNLTFKDAIAGIGQLFGFASESIESIPGQIKLLTPGIVEGLTAPLKYVGDFWKGFFNRILAELPPNITMAIQKGFTDAIAAVEPVFRQILVSLNIEEYFDRAIVKIQSSWQQLGEWLGREDLLRVVGDRLQESLNPEKISQSFLSTVDFIERNWTRLANWIGTTSLFDWLFETLRKASLEFTLFMDFAKERWLDFQKVLAKGEAFQGFFEGLKALGTKLSEWAASTSQAIYGVFPAAPILQIFGKIALLGEKFSHTATFAQEKWNKLSIWLSKSPLIPGALDFLILLGSKFGEMIVGIQSQWPGFVDSLTSGELFGNLPAKIKDFGQSIPELFENIRSGIDKVVPGVNSAIESIQVQWQRLTEFLNEKGLFPRIFDGLNEAFSKIPLGISNVIESIRGQWQRLTEFLNEKGLFPRITEALNEKGLFLRIKEGIQDIPIAFGKAADWIKGKWEKFAIEFQAILKPITDFAEWLGQRLIAALNCSPTVKIPLAWREAAENIIGSIRSLLAPAVWIADQIIKILSFGKIRNGIKSLLSFAGGFVSGFVGAIAPALNDFIDLIGSGVKHASSFIQTLIVIATNVQKGANASTEMTEKLTAVSSAMQNLGKFLGWILKGVEQFSQGMTKSGQDMDRASAIGRALGQIIGGLTGTFVRFARIVLPPLFKVLWIFTQVGIEAAAFAFKVAWSLRYVINWALRVKLGFIELGLAIFGFVKSSIKGILEVKSAFGDMGRALFEFVANFGSGLWELGKALVKLGAAILDAFSPEMTDAIRQTFSTIAEMVGQVKRFVTETIGFKVTLKTTLLAIAAIIATIFSPINAVLIPILVVLGKLAASFGIVKFATEPMQRAIEMLGGTSNKFALAIKAVALTVTAALSILNPAFLPLTLAVWKLIAGFEAFKGVLGLVRKGAKSAVDVFQFVVDILQYIAFVLGPLPAFFTPLITSLSKLNTGFKIAGAAAGVFLMATQPALWPIAAIIAVGTNLGLIREHFAKISMAIATVVLALKPMLAIFLAGGNVVAILSAVNPLLLPIVATIGLMSGAFNPLFKKIGSLFPILKGVAEKLFPVLKSFFDNINLAISAVFFTIKNNFTRILISIATFFLALKPMFAAFMAGSGILTILSSINPLLLPVVATIALLTGGFGKIADLIDNVARRIIAFVKPLTDALNITPFVESAITASTGVVSGGLRRISSVFDNFISGVKTNFTNLFSTIGDGIKRLIFVVSAENIVGRIGSSLNKMNAAFMTSTNPVVMALREVFSALAKIGRTILQLVGDVSIFGFRIGSVFADVTSKIAKVLLAFVSLSARIAAPFGPIGLAIAFVGASKATIEFISNIARLTAEAIPALGELGTAIMKYLEQPLKAVGAIWEKTGGRVIGAIASIGKKAKQTGQEVQGDLSEASPGPTYWIRKNWINTTETIQSRLSDLSLSAKIEGNSIYKFLDRSLTALSPAKIAEAGAALEGLKFDARLAVSNVNQGPKVDPRRILKELELGLTQHQEAYKQGRINRDVYSQGLKNFESTQKAATLAVERDTAVRKQAGESVRSLSLSLGSALSNIAPQLATPIFMVNDLVTSFLDIRATLPGIQTFYAANVATTVAADSAIATSALAKAGIVGSANGAIAASYGFVSGAAKTAYASMIIPILGFVPLILGISAAIFSLYRAYQDNVGGIQGVVEDIGNALREIGTSVFDAISGIASGIVWVIAGILTPLISITKFAFTVFGGLFEALLKIGAAFAVFSFLYQIGIVFASVGAIVTSFGTALTGATMIALSVAGVFTSVLVPIILSGIGAIFTAAMTAILPLLPFIPLILGIIAVGWVLGKVFGFVGSIIGGVFQGIWDSTSEVFGVLFQEIGNVWNALVDLGSQIVEPFAQAFGAIASIFGNFDPSISGIASLIVNTLLIPVKILAFVLITAIKTISGLLIGVIKTLTFIFKVVYKIIESVAIVLGTIAGIVAIIVVAANFGTAIAGVVGIVGAIGAALSGVGTILLAIGSLITAFVIPAIMGGVGAIIAGISAAVIAASPFLAIALGIVAVGWLIKETFCVVGSIITGVFQGIWSLIQWIVSNSLGILAKIPFIGGLFAPPAVSKPAGYATGGLISGMGTSTGDRVPIMASPGEYVINAAAARSNLPLLESINQGNGIEVSNLRALPVPATPIPMSPVGSSQATEINVQFVFGDIVVQGASPSSAAEQFLSEFIKSLESPQAQRVIRTQLRDIVEKAKN